MVAVVNSGPVSICRRPIRTGANVDFSTREIDARSVSQTSSSRSPSVKPRPCLCREQSRSASHHRRCHRYRCIYCVLHHQHRSDGRFLVISAIRVRTVPTVRVSHSIVHPFTDKLCRCRSHRSARQVSNPELVQTSTPNTKPRWRPPSVRFDDLKRCSLSSLSLPDTGLISSLSSMTFKRLVTLILPLALTILICVLIVHTRHYIKQNIILSTQVFQFCVLYENNYYLNLLTLPIALVIILCLVSNQTRIERARSQANKFSIHLPVPFNPFSKIHRFDTMILSGIISHEILGIIEEIFLKTTTAQIKLLTIHGPLFDLIRQIGLVSIVGLRFYPVYAVMDMSHRNILYYALCALYMWLDLALRIFEQIFCVNNSSFVRTWQKFQLLKDETNSIIATSTMAALEDDEFRSGLPRDRMTFRRVRPSTTTMVSSIQVSEQQ